MSTTLSTDEVEEACRAIAALDTIARLSGHLSHLRNDEERLRSAALRVYAVAQTAVDALDRLFLGHLPPRECGAGDVGEPRNEICDYLAGVSKYAFLKVGRGRLIKLGVDPSVDARRPFSACVLPACDEDWYADIINAVEAGMLLPGDSLVNLSTSALDEDPNGVRVDGWGEDGQEYEMVLPASIGYDFDPDHLGGPECLEWLSDCDFDVDRKWLVDKTPVQPDVTNMDYTTRVDYLDDDDFEIEPADDDDLRDRVVAQYEGRCSEWLEVARDTVSGRLDEARVNYERDFAPYMNFYHPLRGTASIPQKSTDLERLGVVVVTPAGAGGDAIVQMGGCSDVDLILAHVLLGFLPPARTRLHIPTAGKLDRRTRTAVAAHRLANRIQVERAVDRTSEVYLETLNMLFHSTGNMRNT